MSVGMPGGSRRSARAMNVPSTPFTRPSPLTSPHWQGIADPICERAESIDGVCESTIVELTRVAGLRSVVDAVAHSVAVAVCQLEYEQSVARTRVDHVTAAEGVVARVEQHHVIHRKGTH